MKKSALKSIGAVLTGLIAVVLLSIGADAVMEKSGIMKNPFHDNALPVKLFVTLYRNIFNVTGCYIAAALSPDRPMRHAMILGTIGFALSIVGAIVMRDEGPAWYPISLIVTALPCAWLGGKLKKQKTHS